MTKKTLLIEVGTEELPSRLLCTISSYFYKNFNSELKKYNFLYKEIYYFSTPRRLALKIIDLNTEEKIIKIKKIGPSIKNAYHQNGLPTEAALNWAKHCKININKTERLKTQKDEYLLYQTTKKQEKIELLLPQITELSLKNIFVPKTMRWELNNNKFFRPIRNIVILLDNKVISGKIFNVSSNHFLHNHISEKEKRIKIKHAIEYPFILFQESNIIADYTMRKKIIIKTINEKVKKINGFIKNNDFLLEEVTNLVESPIACLAKFKEKFLKIPKKILIHIIEKQQKCFPVYNKDNNLLPYFVFISNIHSKDLKKIILGNEKVMHARLSDTEFFIKNDRKIKLLNYLPVLKKVLFQNQLGSLYEKTYRLKSLIEWISQYTLYNIEDAIRATLLSKCDLVTDIVREFPELQGIVGMYYSLKDQEKKNIAIALKEQYLPSFSGDKLPHTSIGCVLSISDKIDTLSGMFYIKKIPSSDKDPFALRRLAIGIIRIIIEKKIPLDLKKLINKSLSLYNSDNINNFKLYDQIREFFTVRLFYWYEEAGYNKNIIKSVLSNQPTKPIEIDQKIQAICFFQKLKHSKFILLSIKRICNILEKAKYDIKKDINLSMITEKEEIILFNEIKNLDFNTKILFKEKKYKEILLKIIDIEKPINNFFKSIKINHSHDEIRTNRLTLLKKLKSILFKITDFSYLY